MNHTTVISMERKEITDLYIYIFASALAISVTTTVVAAEVNFIYMDTANVRQYEAYVGSLTSSQRCSRPGDAPPYKCQIRGLREATEYIILARVCLLGKSTCEPPIEKTARTELRGWYDFLPSSINAICQIF